MGITHVRHARKDEAERTMVLGDMEHITCFLCGHQIFAAMVFWCGSPNERLCEYNLLHLHASCAKELAAHLLKDALRADRIEAGKEGDYWAKLRASSCP
jgi:hypothetical protein